MSGPSSSVRWLVTALLPLPIAALALLVSCSEDEVTAPDPVGPTILINGGAAYTVITSVTISVDAADASRVRFSNTADFANAVGEEVDEVREDWELAPGTGVRMVYAEFRDSEGAAAGAAWDAIEVVGVLPGHPRVTLLHVPGDGSAPVELEQGDFVPYTSVVSFAWSASTPAAEGLPPEALAELDSVPPLDGILGYRYRIALEDCDEADEACYRPRVFDPASGDSVSYYGMVTSLDLVLADYAKALRERWFGDDAATDEELSRRPTPLLYVDALDIAGTTLPLEEQAWTVAVNLPPETEMIVGLDPDNPDPQEYPYWELLTGPFAGTRRHFNAGERIPDGAYVVFKARGRDDPRDELLDPEDLGVDMQGNFTARQRYDGGTYFSFSPLYSTRHRTPAWVADIPGGWTADTLGFLVGPFEYTVRMRAVDEHGRRDPDAPEFTFEANFPPCVQCVELLNAFQSSEVIFDDPCDIASCYDDTARFFTSHLGAPDPSRDYLTPGTPFLGGIWYKISTGEVFLDEPPVAPETFDSVPAYHFSVRVVLHGKETSDFERAADASARIAAWSYQIDYENDSLNRIQDGAPLGIDRLGSFNQRFGDYPEASLYVDEDGVWFVRVRVAVPLMLQLQGPVSYFQMLFATYDDYDAALAAWDLTTKQIGYGQVRAQATDQPTCAAATRPPAGKYWYFDGVRIPAGHPRRACFEPTNPDWYDVELENFRSITDVVTRHFRFGVESGAEGDYFGGPSPFAR